MARPPLKERFQSMLVEYGKVALGVYFAIFAVVLIGFAMAIQMGVHVGSASGTVGTWGAAYVATKLAQPLRILATLALTPVIVKLFSRRKPQEG